MLVQRQILKTRGVKELTKNTRKVFTILKNMLEHQSVDNLFLKIGFTFSPIW